MPIGDPPPWPWPIRETYPAYIVDPNILLRLDRIEALLEELKAKLTHTEEDV